MPQRHPRCKPDGYAAGRARSGSQSSLEIQVAGAEAISVQTPCGSVVSAESSCRGQHQHRAMDWHGRMVLPTTDFLRLLKTVGAQGEMASCGELFTIKQICFYLKEYIKYNQLYDTGNVLLVHCENDPLGKVFGVKSFTFQDTLSLVMKNILVIDNSFTRWGHLTPPLTSSTSKPAAVTVPTSPTNANISVVSKDSLTLLASGHHDNLFSLHDNINQVSSTTTVPSAPRKQFSHDQCQTEDEAEDGNKTLHSQCSSAVKHLFHDKACSDIQVEQRDEESGEITQPGRNHHSTSPVELIQHSDSEQIHTSTNRKRQHTKSECLPRQYPLSKYDRSTDEQGISSHSLSFDLDIGDTDSDETIYSIQSKETAYVKDSSDDLWFLEEDEASVDQQSIQSGHYNEEYELETEVESVHSNENSLTDGSESPCELLVVCDDSDVQFWADSESEDESLEDVRTDKWKCSKCGTSNQPLCRHCNRCWSIRPGWLPDQHDRLSSRSKNYINTEIDNENKHNQSVPISPSPEEGHCHEPSASYSDLPVSGVSKSSYCKTVVMEHFLSSQPELVQSQKGLMQNPKLLDMKVDNVGDITSISGVSSTQAASEEAANTEHFKVPPAVNMSNESLGLCNAKGRLLPRLKLPMDDSGNGSLTSSQESTSAMATLGQDGGSTSPVKKPKLTGQLEKYTASPRKCPVSPYRRYSPFPASPFSAKQNHFQFDNLLSPGKRLCQSDRYSAGLSGANVSTAANMATTVNSSPLKLESTRKIFFVEPLPSPKKRAPNGVEYSDLCMICLSKPKEASIIHGKTGHQVCCYLCAKRLRRRGKPCPVCRRHIQKVVKNYLV